MKTKSAKPGPQNRPDDDEIEGYPGYPPTEDIYGNFEKTEDEDPDIPDSVRRRTSHRIVEKFLAEDDSEDDLDSASEFDDDLEIIGDEDEDDDYYDLGVENDDDN